METTKIIHAEPDTKLFRTIIHRTIPKDFPKLGKEAIKGGFHYSGDISTFCDSKRPRIVITGTRDTGPYAIDVTHRAVAAIAANPAKPVIITGLAFGVNITVVRHALDAGVPVVAVMPCGLNNVYPLTHTEIAEKLRKTPGCALLSTYPDDRKLTDAESIMAKNYLMTLLADTVIITATRMKGGSNIIARTAYQIDVPVLAVPGRIDDPTSQGCNGLIHKGIATCLADMTTLVNIAVTPSKP